MFSISESAIAKVIPHSCARWRALRRAVYKKAALKKANKTRVQEFRFVEHDAVSGCGRHQLLGVSKVYPIWILPI